MPDDEQTRPAWNPPPGDAAAQPAWNLPPDETETVAAYSPTVPAQTPPAPPPPPAYAPPQEELAETISYAAPAAPAQPPQPAQQPPAYSPPEQPPAYVPPAYTPPAYTPPAPAYTPPAPAYAPPQQPAYQAGYPATPVEQQQKKSRAGCVVGCLVTLVLVLGLVGGGLYYLSQQPNGVNLGGLTIGGANTGPRGGSLIYSDPLNGDSRSGWTNDSNCFFGSGGYHIKASFICYAPANQTGDGVTTVTVSQISGPITYGYGLVIRRVSKGNYYEFQIDANGKWLFTKVVNGTSTDIVKFTANAAIKKGLNQPNTLSVTAQGSHFIFSVNGTQVGTADDSTFTSGGTGLFGNDGIEVVFTSLSIEKLKA
jgi:hypothetical protein